jgi:hypothetical protein
MKHIIALVMLTTMATTAAAGPKSLKKAGTGVTEDGRTYYKIEVMCSGKKEPRTLINFEGKRGWCLEDESMCGKKMRMAKKACKS